jgi:hypothetical protein
MANDLSSWLAAELDGRIAKTDLRTGPLLRRTSKIVSTQQGLPWECYVNAASVWLWINGRVLGDEAGFSVNKKYLVMGFSEPLDAAFERLSLPVYVWPANRPPEPYPREHARRTCRRLEPLFASLDLGRGEYLTATPDQITLWNRRPSAPFLQRRIQLLRGQFGKPHADG